MILILTISCGSLKNQIKKTHTKADKLSDQIFIKNNNVFTLGSTHLNFSYVWTISKNHLIIYKVQGEKVRKKTDILYTENLIQNLPGNQEMKFNNCYELDGDFLKYKIQGANDKTITDTLPINITCFLNEEKEQDFYEQIEKIIRTNNLNWN